MSFVRLGSLVLLWRRGTNVLTASTLKVTTDERVKLVNGYNLEISELEPQDAGDYVRPLRTRVRESEIISSFSALFQVCQISDKVNRDQTHTVEILGELSTLHSFFPAHHSQLFVAFCVKETLNK